MKYTSLGYNKIKFLTGNKDNHLDYLKNCEFELMFFTPDIILVSPLFG